MTSALLLDAVTGLQHLGRSCQSLLVLLVSALLMEMPEAPNVVFWVGLRRFTAVCSRRIGSIWLKGMMRARILPLKTAVVADGDHFKLFKRARSCRVVCCKMHWAWPWSVSIASARWEGRFQGMCVAIEQ